MTYVLWFSRCFILKLRIHIVVQIFNPKNFTFTFIVPAMQIHGPWIVFLFPLFRWGTGWAWSREEWQKKVLMGMKVLLNEEHPAPLWFGKIISVGTFLCPNWRRRGPPPDRLYSWVYFLPNHGMDHIMSLWISKGQTQCDLANRTESEAR